jgi:hypothetical protein
MNLTARFLYLFTTLILSTVCLAQNSDKVTISPNAAKDSTKKSISARAVGVIGSDTIVVDYYSPAVRGRNIWGGLVPYDEVWVTGAHGATAIDFPKDFSVGSSTIPAGRYAFFTIPGKEEWTIILNKNWEQHLTDDYDAKEDVVRLKVKPQKNEHTERLEYFVIPGKGNGGSIVVAWEKLKVELPFIFKK